LFEVLISVAGVAELDVEDESVYASQAKDTLLFSMIPLVKRGTAPRGVCRYQKKFVAFLGQWNLGSETPLVILAVVDHRGMAADEEYF